MKVIYRAFDGTEFDTERECLDHEKENPPFAMFSPKGKANTLENCAIVKINSEEEYYRFCSLCNLEGYDVPDFYIPSRGMAYPILIIFSNLEGVWTCIYNDVLQVLEDNAAEIFKED